MRRLLSKLHRLIDDRRGTTATIFAVMAVPLTLAAGGAVDTAGVYAVQTKLQASMDAAVLAGVSKSTDKQAASATAVFSAGFVPPAQLAGSATVVFTPGVSDGTLKGVAQVDVKTSVLKMVGINKVTVSRKATAKMATADQSCILTYGTGMAATDVSMAFTGSPVMSLEGCGLRSNTSMSCSGHDGNAMQSMAMGTASGCSNATVAAPVPDIYAAIGTTANINAQCGSSTKGGTWTPTSKPNPSAMITVANAKGYTEYHVCGDLTLSGTGTLTALSTTTDSVIVVENGKISVANGSSIVAPHTAFVLTGSSTTQHTVDFPQGHGQSASLAITPPALTTNPWRAIAIYQNPALTTNVDITWGPGSTLTADGLLYFPKSNFKTSGNGSSNNSKCTKFAVKTFTSNGSVNLNFSQTGCSKVGLTQWPGVPYLIN